MNTDAREIKSRRRIGVRRSISVKRVTLCSCREVAGADRLCARNLRQGVALAVGSGAGSRTRLGQARHRDGGTSGHADRRRRAPDCHPSSGRRTDRSSRGSGIRTVKRAARDQALAETRRRQAAEADRQPRSNAASKQKNAAERAARDRARGRTGTERGRTGEGRCGACTARCGTRAADVGGAAGSGGSRAAGVGAECRRLHVRPRTAPSSRKPNCANDCSVS